MKNILPWLLTIVCMFGVIISTACVLSIKESSDTLNDDFFNYRLTIDAQNKNYNILLIEFKKLSTRSDQILDRAKDMSVENRELHKIVKEQSATIDVLIKKFQDYKDQYYYNKTT